MSKRNEIVDIDMHLHPTSSERAVLVSKDGEEKNAVWLPISQIEVMPKQGNHVVVTVPTWLAEERNLA